MITAVRLTASLCLALVCANIIFAQVNQETNSQPQELTVTTFASSERVRFTAPASVAQMRLEVYDAAGRKLFDNELRGGKTRALAWQPSD
jgi:hypothetical protein